LPILLDLLDDLREVLLRFRDAPEVEHDYVGIGARDLVVDRGQRTVIPWP